MSAGGRIGTTYVFAWIVSAGLSGLTTAPVARAEISPDLAEAFRRVPPPPAVDETCVVDGARVISEESLAEFQRTMEALEHWAVNLDHGDERPCRVAAVPTPEEMSTWLRDEFSGARRATRTVAGVELRDQPVELLALFEKLVAPRERGPASSEPLNVPAGCHEFFCAVSGALGAEESVRIAYLLARFEYNASWRSPPQFSNEDEISPLEPAELDDIITAMHDLPPNLVRISANHPMLHFRRGYVLAWDPLGATLANATVTLFDTWSGKSGPVRQQTVLHEVGHNVADELDLDESPEWLALSGWEQRSRQLADGKSEKIWVPNRPEQILSAYGGSNPAEDFAETFIAYRYDPERLQRASPAKYRFMKEVVYDGIEYTSEEACNQRQPTSAGLLRAARAAASDRVARGGTTPVLPRDVVASCRDEIMTFLGDGSPRPAGLTRPVRECLSRQLVRTEMERGARAGGLRYPELYARMLRRSRTAIPDSSAILSGASGERAELEVRARLRAVVSQLLRERIADPDDLSLRVAMRAGKTPAEYCSSETRYAYQRASHFKYLMATPEDQARAFANYAYDQRELLGRWTERACLSVFGTGTKLRKPRSEQVDRAIGELFRPVPAASDRH